ncbi:aminotransferase class I/II-fold pyridoxal phosphate-dependent enzyme [Pseudofulvibacter geojedonensis]|uniref:Aminotransferase class I/II-fold pyridoxal phosphate-dependent enzyme n=1 Tax=Pseudofulvibacter geojedonensis TaxID=1123758 RepID=A0ABW3HY17_9FLAO
MTLEQLQTQFEAFKAKKLSLDMSRGKPSAAQLDLSNELLDTVTSNDYLSSTGAETRNYGGLDGLPATKQLFKDFLEVSSVEEVVIGGNASLTIMHDIISRGITHGMCDSYQPWGKEKIKFICPVPGYDRHFSICEHFGIDMIPVACTEDGPDMDVVEKLVANDSSIKGIWIVPKYSNPTGLSCSDEVVNRLSMMNTAAEDFRIFWDNAYAVHHLSEDQDQLKNILTTCKEFGNDNRPFILCSTSKITFAGAGVAAVGGSTDNMDWYRKHLFISTIGPDKLNQERHNRFFKNIEGLYEHMKKHAALLKPRFVKTLSILEEELGGTNLATWTKPKGGYFISFNVPEGCAKRVVALSAEAGVKLTGAGATYPYKKDPKNSNIRLAPSCPTIDEIEQAMRIVCLATKIAALEMKASVAV